MYMWGGVDFMNSDRGYLKIKELRVQMINRVEILYIMQMIYRKSKFDL